MLKKPSPFMFGYARWYYLTHPWKFAADLWRNIKWAWQRVFRGWDNKTIWGIHWHISAYMPIWLEKLKKDKVGFPCGVLDDESDFDGLSDKEYADTEAKWDSLVDDMIAGFIAARQIIEQEYPIYDSFYQEAEERGIDMWEDEEEYDVLYEAMSVQEIKKKQEAEAYETYNHGMDVFKEWFFGLWD